ncbi:hypothetical protein JW962_02940 [Candidatus Dojkabacteria bacterium]|nr:hypothetical protein [Candidatus Dojkabacteria bacterium]
MALSIFHLDGQDIAVSYISESEVFSGVICEVYTIPSANGKYDLGVIYIDAGKETPLQRVLKGSKTVEGHISGKGKLLINQGSDDEVVYEVSDDMSEPFQIEVKVGQTMKWIANPESKLTVYEICYPPYEDGRYENLE